MYDTKPEKDTASVGLTGEVSTETKVLNH